APAVAAGGGRPATPARTSVSAATSATGAARVARPRQHDLGADGHLQYLLQRPLDGAAAGRLAQLVEVKLEVGLEHEGRRLTRLEQYRPGVVQQRGGADALLLADLLDKLPPLLGVGQHLGEAALGGRLLESFGFVLNRLRGGR